MNGSGAAVRRFADNPENPLCFTKEDKDDDRQQSAEPSRLGGE